MRQMDLFNSLDIFQGNKNVPVWKKVMWPRLGWLKLVANWPWSNSGCVSRLIFAPQGYHIFPWLSPYTHIFNLFISWKILYPNIPWFWPKIKSHTLWYVWTSGVQNHRKMRITINLIICQLLKNRIK